MQIYLQMTEGDGFRIWRTPCSEKKPLCGAFELRMETALRRIRADAWKPLGKHNNAIIFKEVPQWKQSNGQ